MLTWHFIAIAMVFYALGEYFSKLYADNPRTWCAVLSVLSYTATAVLWLPALSRHNHLAVLGTVWTMTATVVTLLVAFLLFHERVNSYQAIGVAVGLVAIYLMSK